MQGAKSAGGGGGDLGKLIASQRFWLAAMVLPLAQSDFGLVARTQLLTADLLTLWFSSFGQCSAMTQKELTFYVWVLWASEFMATESDAWSLFIQTVFAQT